MSRATTQPVKPATATATGPEVSAGTHGGGDGHASGGSQADELESDTSAEEDVDVELLQQILMPVPGTAAKPVATQPAPAANATTSGGNGGAGTSGRRLQAAAGKATAGPSSATSSASVSSDFNSVFSLLSNLELYIRPRPRTRTRPGEARHSPLCRDARRPPPPFPHLRLRYLPTGVRTGDVLASYYQSFLAPDQVCGTDKASNTRGQAHVCLCACGAQACEQLTGASPRRNVGSNAGSA